MKTLKKTCILLFGSALMGIGCDKNDTGPVKNVEIKIIGIEPCTMNATNGSKKGYVLLLTATKDTVVTFNLPLTLARRYDVSPVANGISSGPITANLNYHYATKEEMVYVPCLAIYTSPYINKQVVIDDN